MPLLPDQIDDFVTATIAKYERRKWKDITLPLQRYIFADRMLNGPGNRVGKRTEIGVNSHALKWLLQVTNVDTFQDTELYGLDNPSVQDTMVTASVDWTFQQDSFMYDIREDELQTGSFEVVVDLISTRLHSMFNSFYQAMETRMWTAPTSSTAAKRKPYGIPFWLQKATTAAFSFQGGDPSGFSSGAANVSTDTYANWKNGAFGYTTVSDDDLLTKVSQSMDYCNFMPPHNYAELDGGKPDFEFYTVYSVIQSYQQLLSGANDNLGRDMGKYRNSIMYRNVPVTWVPALDNSESDAVDTSNPWYGINWNTLCFKCKDGWIMKKSKPIVPDRQHNVRTVFLDNIGQFKCTDRRANFVGSVL